MSKILRRLNEAEKLISIYEKYYEQVDIIKSNSEEYFYFRSRDYSLCTEYWFEHPDGIELGKLVYLQLKGTDHDLGINIYSLKHDPNLLLGKISRYDEKWIPCGSGSSRIRNITRINNLDINDTIRTLENFNCNSELIEKIKIDLESKQSVYDKLRERIGLCKKK